MQHWDKVIFDAIEAYGWPVDAIARLVLAALAGGLVGLEREVRGRQAGFRTNLLVCLGSAIVMIVSTRIAHQDWPHGRGYFVNIDPARIAYGVMGGVGFLGAGAIIKGDGSVRGLTTAAGLWCVAAMGLAAGLGLYLFTVAATVMVVAALWVLDYASQFLPRTHYRTVIVRRPWAAGCVAQTVDQLRGLGYRVVDYSFERAAANPHFVDVNLTVAFKTRQQFGELAARLPQDGGSYDLLAVREA